MIFYETDDVQIHFGDCREILPTLPRGGADLIVTDPPYGMNWQSNRRVASDKFDHIEGDNGGLDVVEALRLSIRALKKFRHLYVFGDFDLSTLPVCDSVELIWDKDMTGMGNLEIPWGPAHEKIAFAVYVPSPANRIRGDGRLAARMRKGSILRCRRPNASGVTRHPTEKPVELLRQIIESSSVMGETVLDPFMGSGSTLEAAVLEGRRAIGIEVNEKYCSEAVERLSKLFARAGQ